jgi:hypothetical protein
MIVRFVTAILFALTVFLALPKSAQAVETLPDHKITVQQKKVGLRDALTHVLEGTNYKYRISNNVTNDKKVSLDVKDAPWDEVFKFLISEGELNYRITAKRRILISP